VQFPIFTDNVTITGDGTEEHPLAATGGGGATPGAPDKSVQFNHTGAFTGSVALTFDTTPGSELLSLDFSAVADYAGSEFSSTSNFLQITGGTTKKATIDIGATTVDAISIINAEPASGGITIKDTSATVTLDSTAATGGIVLNGGVGGIFLTLTGGTFSAIGDSITPAIIAIGAAIDELGFFGATSVVKPTVAGAKLPGDVVMASLLAALVALGLIADTTT